MSQLLAGIGHGMRSLLLRSGSAALRFPLSVLCLVAISLVYNLDTADLRLFGPEIQRRLVTALATGGAAGVAVKLLGESLNWRSVVAGMAAAGATVVIACIVWFGDALAIAIPPLVIGLILTVPIAGYVGRGTSTQFWAFTYWMVIGTALAFLSVFLFVLGLWAIFEMVGYLFGVATPQRAFDHIWTTAGTLVGPLFALGRIPQAFDLAAFDGERDPAAVGLRALFDFVAIPLTLVTALILHLYAARILVTMEFPRNQVGWIVLIFLFLVLGLRVAAEPFLDGRSVAARSFRRAWAFMIVVPLALLVYALALRITDEGLTVERYYLGLAAFAAALVLVAQLRPRWRQDIRPIAAIPVALLIFSSFGLWGANASVARSQGERVLSLVGAGSEARALPLEQKIELRSRLYVIDDVGGMETILPALPAVARDAYTAAGTPDWQRASALMTALALDGLPSDSASDDEPILTFEGTRTVSLDTFDRALLSLELADGQGPFSDPTGLSAELRDGVLVLGNGRTADRFAVSEIVAALTGPATTPGTIDRTGGDGRTIRLVVRRAELALDRRSIQRLEATILYRSAEWD